MLTDSLSGSFNRTSLPAPARGMVERIVRRLLARLEAGTLDIALPDGRVLSGRGSQPGPHGRLELVRWRGFLRVLFAGPTGFAEGYIRRDWTTPDLVALIAVMGLNETSFGRTVQEWPLRAWLDRRLHARNDNSRSGSRRNIMAHYDLGNAFYRLWLDRSMTYSAALYPPDGSGGLDAAQDRKMAAITRLLAPETGQSVLEIGCGWGGLATHLACAAGVSVRGLTLSEEQFVEANLRFAKAGVQHRASAHIEDYRDASGQYDRIVSIEMIEAVGEKWWPVYFAKIAALLKPGGRAVIQAITIAPERFDAYRRRPDFIQRYIFPGGMLPTPEIIAQQANRAGLAPHCALSFGQGYALTLDEWRRRFHAATPEIAALGYPVRFRRIWDYYLAYCQAGFEIGAIDVHLITLDKPL